MRTNVYNNPFYDFVGMTDAVSKLFEQQQRPYDYARNGGSVGSDQVARLPLDAWTTDDAFVITAYLPGIKPEDVEITFEGEELTIRGKYQPLPEGVTPIKRELFHGAFERRLTFNVPVNIGGIEAVHEHGVLTLTVPKAEEIKPKQIKIQVK